jgi:ribosome-associated translation inhibitor RaiA
MQFPDESYNLRIELDTKNCTCSPDEIRDMEEALEPLSTVVEEFPVSDLYITIIYHKPSNDYHVKTALVLSGRTLFTGDRDDAFYPAYERCMRKLVKKVEAYKHRLSNQEEQSKRQKGTYQDVSPSFTPDSAVLAQAVDAGDYAAFRRAASAYEESVRKRVGRWVQRYPALEAEIDVRLTIDDVVEEVFLNAFDQYDNRQGVVPVGEWLESLIDPSVKALMRHPDQELENINWARTVSETPPEAR